MKATLNLKNIELWAGHGCYREEEKAGNRYLINISLIVDIDGPAQTDDVRDAVNYVEVYSLVKEEMARPRHLIESVAYGIAGRIKAEFGPRGVTGGEVRMAKMAPPVGGPMECVEIVCEI